MQDREARFRIGELVRHRLFHYRGVVYDVDPVFDGTDEWYERVARSRPPKDRPWYRVLVDDSGTFTYVAERNLEHDPSGKPVRHAAVEHYFSGLRDGYYEPKQTMN